MIGLKHNGQTFVQFNSDSRWPVVQKDAVGVYHQLKENSSFVTTYQFLQYPTPSERTQAAQMIKPRVGPDLL
jgi:hypothetical protein